MKIIGNVSDWLSYADGALIKVADSAGSTVMRKQCLHFFSAVLDLILFILACNDNIHESLDGFEIYLDLTTGFHGNR